MAGGNTETHCDENARLGALRFTGTENAFGRFWHAEPNAISNAISYAKFFSRSHGAAIVFTIRTAT
jgi:hypothetical protein